MIDALPWMLLLAVAAAVIGYFAGRRATPSPTDAGLDAPRTTVPRAKGYGADAAVAPPNTASSLPPERSTPPQTSPANARATAAAVGATASRRSQMLAQARSWGYQLQNLDLRRAEASPFDLLVIDYAKDGSDASALKPAEIERLKLKSNGQRRLVVAYCSIGEAESYRSYWQKGWGRDKPAWLLGENPEWEENYSVCFWDDGWQKIVCGTPEALIDRILAQGFDGVYLDKCDVYEDLREHFKSAARSRPDIEGDMVAFVRRISSYAKMKRPGFLVIMQNAEPLLARAELRQAIDAVAKEELLFGLDRPEKPNTRAEIEESRIALDRMKADGKPVFMVEYLNARPRIHEAQAAADKLGYVLYVAPKDRELDRLNDAIAEA